MAEMEERCSDDEISEKGREREGWKREREERESCV